MRAGKNLILGPISCGALLVVFILSADLVVMSQGWRSHSVSHRKSRPKTRKTAKTPNTNSNAVSSAQQKATPPTEKQNADTAKNQASRERRVNNSNSADAHPPKTGRCDPDRDERTDFSGTYTGNVNYPSDGLMGDATLTISNNRFSLRTSSKSETGNFTAVTTCNYTAVAMMFGEWRIPQPGEPAEPPLPMLSLRAIKQGDRLTLKASPSERRVFSFDPAPKK